MSLQGTRFDDTASVNALVERCVETLEALPGVVAAASTWTLPVELAFSSTFRIEGRPLGPEPVHGQSLMRPVSANYARVFGIPLRRGRFFDARDTGSSAAVAVISEAMARKFWPQGDPVGRRITVDPLLGPDFAAPPREIVGIAGDVRDLALNQEPGPMIYVPQSQVPNGMTRIDVRVLPLTWAVRTASEPYSYAAAIERGLRSASGGLAAGRVRSMAGVMRQSTARNDFHAVLLTAFAAAALLLAVVGIYGLISYSVEQRTRELGIRLALGATPAQVRRMVARQGLGLAVVGMAAGLAGSVGLSRFMETLLYGVKPADPAALGLSCLVLGSAAALAAYLPARRAARVDPVEALRSG